MAGVVLPHGRMTKWDRGEGYEVRGDLGMLLRASSHSQRTGEAIGGDWTARRDEVMKKMRGRRGMVEGAGPLRRN
jgi:hypothetical protein